MNECGATLKTYWSQFDRLCVENGLVCRQWLEKGKVNRLQVIIPKGSKSKILKFCHDEKTGGHFGVRKTLAKVRNGYYWAGLQNDVRNYCKSCETCCNRLREQNGHQCSWLDRPIQWNVLLRIY